MRIVSLNFVVIELAKSNLSLITHALYYYTLYFKLQKKIVLYYFFFYDFLILTFYLKTLFPIKIIKYHYETNSFSLTKRNLIYLYCYNNAIREK